MKRFHVHLAVPELDASIRFYSKLFGAAPSVQKDDYAKWMLDDPRVNFAISSRGQTPGLNHLGFQVDSDADLAVLDELNASCCYAQSDKHWVQDPQGIAWESFHSLASIPVFGAPAQPDAAACCTPQAVMPQRSTGAGCGSAAAATPAATQGAKSGCCG